MLLATRSDLGAFLAEDPTPASPTGGVATCWASRCDACWPASSRSPSTARGPRAGAAFGEPVTVDLAVPTASWTA